MHLRSIRSLPFRRRGAASLFLIIVTIPLALVLTTSLQIVRRQADEARLVRAMRAQLQVSLANYDQDLFRQFGLFGVASSNLQTSVYSELVPRSFSRQPVQLTQTQSIFSADILAKQIARTMQIRMPLLWINNLADTVKKGTTAKSATEILPAAGAVAAIPSLDTADELLDGPLKPVLDLLQSQLIDALIDGLKTVVEPELKAQLSDLMALIDDIGDLRATYSGPGGSSGLLNHITDVLDAISQGTDSVLLRQFELAEYCIAYLTRTVTSRQDNGQLTPLVTVSGLKLNDLILDRPAEVEQVLTGAATPQTATRQVQLMIIALRSLINLADILTDQARMDGFRVQALAISTVISVASGATINIDPQLFACLLAVGQSIHTGQQDYQALADGHAVALFQDRLSKYSIKLTYQDYLRLFLLSVPQDVLIRRIGNQIRAAMALDFAHEVSMTVMVSAVELTGWIAPGKPICLSMSYDA